MFNWFKVAFRFLTKQHFSLAVASAIQHCFRFGWKERALVGALSGCLIGQGSGITCFGLIAFGGQLALALWFSSENQSEIAVLSQVNHVFVVKHNKQFKRDSQRLVFLLLLQF
ncbi:hypothetical protein [Vibrio parahaemolyticus]|uniref:hypothetical protein n=1 Tax=Vibrio parahaemolyticus TaxID=670 RepID=UPI0015DD9D72|nr:hypothetical protein [Vibrio parahaemolyticus]